MDAALLTHEYDGDVGQCVKSEAGKLAQHGFRVAVIYPSEHEDITVDGNITVYSISTTVKTHLNVVTKALILVPEFTRAFSSLLYDYGFSFNLIYSYEWIAGVAGVVLKTIFRRPLIASIHSTEYMRSSEVGLLQLSIRGYEKQVFEEANLILARSRNTFLSIVRDYGVEELRVVKAFTIDRAVEAIVKVFKK